MISIYYRSRTLPDELKLNFQCSGVGEIVCSSTQGGVVTSGGGFSNSNVRERDVSSRPLRLKDMTFYRIIPHIRIHYSHRTHTHTHTYVYIYMCMSTDAHKHSLPPSLCLSLSPSLPLSQSIFASLTSSLSLSLSHTQAPWQVAAVDAYLVQSQLPQSPLTAKTIPFPPKNTFYREGR